MNTQKTKQEKKAGRVVFLSDENGVRTFLVTKNNREELVPYLQDGETIYVSLKTLLKFDDFHRATGANHEDFLFEDESLKEEWRDIKGFEGVYQVSSLGRIKSLAREVLTKNGKIKPIKEKILKLNDNGEGYKLITLYGEFGRRRETVHVLLAEAFLGHQKGSWDAICDHINHNPSDNRLENIQIITQRENVSRKRGDFTSEYVGVCRRAGGKFTAQISIEGTKYHLGSFNQEIQAAQAYQEVLEDIESFLELKQRENWLEDYEITPRGLTDLEGKLI